ncbi:MAG TPA: prepilin-type N-terminal cleavage/methylation domain-containing protein [Povalibacter sp.]|nr:prepilin-type N-terminal cleavage/methylation domain-containing protein [Povalibacter sp.]
MQADTYNVRSFAATGSQRPRRARGFTLLELLAAVAIAGLLVTIALPSYNAIIQRQKTQTAIRDLTKIAMLIQNYHTAHFAYPMSLADVGANNLRDPWGNPYAYLNFASPGPGVNGQIRKDHNLHPINSDFDLYSMGPDGDSQAPLTARASRDDIVYGRDGSFIGVAADF